MAVPCLMVAAQQRPFLTALVLGSYRARGLPIHCSSMHLEDYKRHWNRPTDP